MMISIYSIDKYSNNTKYFQDLSNEHVKNLYNKINDKNFVIPIINYSDSIVIGPLYSKGKGCCCFCLESRNNFTTFSKKSSKNILYIHQALVTSIILNMIKNKEYNACYIISYTKEIELERHKLLNRFDCEICGENDNDNLGHNFKEVWDTDTLRLRDAALYLEELENTLIDKNFGIVKSVATKKFFDGYQVIAVMEEEQRTNSSSFSRNKNQAKAVCLFEAIERYSSLKPRFKLEKIQSSILYFDSFIKPEEYMYEINEKQVVKWLSVVDISNDLTQKFIPEGTIFNTAESKKINYQPSSNGIATGTSIKEAQLHALLEVNERDALLLQWYSDKPLKDITKSVKECLNYKDKISRYGYTHRIFDITSDTNIPTIWIVAELVEKNSNLPHFVFGSSSMLNITDAIEAAFKEILMILLNDYRYKRIIERINFIQKGKENVETVEDHLYYYGFNQEGIEYMKSYMTRSHSTTLANKISKTNYTLQTSLDFILEKFNKCGIDSYYLDITPKEININNLSVVKVICTNTISISFGYRETKNDIKKIEKLQRNGFDKYKFNFNLHPLA